MSQSVLEPDHETVWLSRKGKWYQLVVDGEEIVVEVTHANRSTVFFERAGVEINVPYVLFDELVRCKEWDV